MRYTTIIDLTEMPELYKNPNVRLLYLHMVLKSGYHDNDRDWLRASIRRLAADTGLTESATRHALAMLQKAKLIARKDGYWAVRKWIAEQPISARAKSKRAAQLESERAAREAADSKRDAEIQAQRETAADLAKEGKTSFMAWYEGQLDLAAKGDEKAAQSVERHRNTYDMHKRNLQQQQIKKS